MSYQLVALRLAAAAAHLPPRHFNLLLDLRRCLRAVVERNDRIGYVAHGIQTEQGLYAGIEKNVFLLGLSRSFVFARSTPQCDAVS